MSYYATVNSKVGFASYAAHVGEETFDDLYQSEAFHRAVSRWDATYLLASRVICAKPQGRLALFDDGHFPRSARGVHDCIDRLVDGPTAGFRDQYEPHIVQQHQPDSLGYVWAALARLLQAEPAIDPKPDRSKRERQPVRHAGYVSSTSMQVGSSSPTGSTSSSSVASLHWVDRISSAPLEDLTVRLASCFIRCVINYAQPIDKAFPIHFRDERLAHAFKYADAKWIKATDDGGVQVSHSGSLFQVAIIEGKRAFQQFTTEGTPTVSDNTLGQLVGQALARRRARSPKSIMENELITILAVTHYIKFFNFHITDKFIEEYEKPLPTTDYLRVSSTDWFDLGALEHRKVVVKHILAMLAWADKQRGRHVDESEDSGDKGGDGGGEGDSDESMES